MSHFQQFSSSFSSCTSDEQTSSETRIYTITENCSYGAVNDKDLEEVEDKEMMAQSDKEDYDFESERGLDQ